MLSQNQVLHQGRYRIIHPFGNSDSTGLYEAYDTVNDTKVVLRERSGSLTSNITPGQIETLKITFAEQAKRLADMKHDVLLGVRDFFSETGRQYLVLESFDGQDLSEFIGIDTAPAMSDVVKWADQLLDALEYLHSRNPAIIHLNINPQNIRLTSEFKIKLLLTATDGIEEGSGGSDATDGSMNYKALEQLWLGLDYASQKVIANSLDEKSEEILRSPADARTDLYGLAATLYHLLTRSVPADPLARIIDILDGNDDPLTAPHVANPEIPVAISEFLMKALEIKREDRFASATDMRQALQAMSAVVSPAGKPAQAQTRVEAKEADKSSDELETRQNELEEERQPVAREQREAAEAERLKAEARTRTGAENSQKPEQKARPEQKPAASARPQSPKTSPLDEIKLELAGDDLLDLPDDGPVVTAPPAPTAANVLSLDSRPVVAQSEFGSTLAAVEKKGAFGDPLIIVGAAAALLIVAAAGWFMLGSGSAPQASPQATVTVPQQTTVEQAPAPEQAPVITETVTVSAQDAKPEADKRTEAEKKAEAERKAKKAANAEVKPTPEAKKKVTVDDLINDN